MALILPVEIVKSPHENPFADAHGRQPLDLAHANESSCLSGGGKRISSGSLVEQLPGIPMQNQPLRNTSNDAKATYSVQNTNLDTSKRNPMFACQLDATDPDSWRYYAPRSHGCERPYHPMQLGAMGLKLVGIGLFWTAVIPPLVALEAWEVMSPFIAANVIFTLLFVIAQVLLTVWENGDVEGEGHMCNYCQRKTDADSRHCKSCNKCITGFDHHCKWLNTCIGSKNYRAFIAYLVGTSLSMLSALTASLVLLIKWWHVIPQQYGTEYYRIGPVVLASLMFLGVVPIVHLLGFHGMLWYLGMTTYEYIMDVREKELQRQSENI